MKLARLILRGLPFLSVALFIAPTGAHSQDTVASATLLSRLDPAYGLTATGFGSADRVTSPGTIYVVRVDGLLARAIANHITPTNTVKDGILQPPAKGFLGAFGTAGDTEQVKPGQRFYVHEIKADADSVTFTLISLDTISTVVQGASTHSRIRLYLRFMLPKQEISTLTSDQMHALTNTFFLPEGDPAATPTVKLGQSAEQVKKLLGDPDKIVALGPKQIFVYKDLKVTMVDGKVTDAE